MSAREKSTFPDAYAKKMRVTQEENTMQDLVLSLTMIERQGFHNLRESVMDYTELYKLVNIGSLGLENW